MHAKPITINMLSYTYVHVYIPLQESADKIFLKNLSS